MRIVYLISLFFVTYFISGCQEVSDWYPLLKEEGFSNFETLNGDATYQRLGNSIIGTTKLNTPNTFLATKEHYSDFELKFDVRISVGLNSGVQIRSLSDSSYLDGRVHGYQVEIEDSERGWAGGIYDEGRRGWLYPLKWNAKGRNAFVQNEWNHYHILAKGNTLQTWVNGIPCAHLVDGMTAEGFIGFQVHAIGDSSQANRNIEWKNILIKTINVGKDVPAILAPEMIIPETENFDISEFNIDPRFKIQQLAGESLLAAPVTGKLDVEGNLWVVELPGYMRDIDGADENRPDGRVVILSDLNNDGSYDRRLVFKNNLIAPRAVELIYGGVLYNHGRALYFEDLKTGENTLVDSNYVQGMNIEHQPNGLMFNIDNWIYSAKSNKKYRKRNGQWEIQNTSVRGQWGISKDILGRLVYNNNSDGLRGDRSLPNSVVSNDYLRPNNLLNNQLCSNNRLFPIQSTSVNRGYMKGVLDEQGKLVKYTSACAPMIFLTKGEFENNAFVCAPEVNLIKRYKKQLNSDVFAQGYDQYQKDKEFLTSSSESFRPVHLIQNPNDGLLVIDFRKGIIQHRAYMTNYLREKIIEKGMHEINNQGRLYYVSPIDKESTFKGGYWKASEIPMGIVQLLDSPSGEVRLAAQKYLVGQMNLDYTTMIRKSMQRFSEIGQMHAIRTLEAKGTLDEIILKNIFEDSKPVLTYHILNIYDQDPTLINPEVIESVWKSKHPELILQLCHMLPYKNGFKDYIHKLIQAFSNSEPHSEALVSNVPIEVLEKWAVPNSILSTLVNNVKENQRNNNRVNPIYVSTEFNDARNEGFPSYSKYCASCHGMDGLGQDGLAPPLLHSEYIEGASGKLAAVILQGLHGPINVKGLKYDLGIAMPGLKQNEEVTDEIVAGIIAFVNNAFSKSGSGINTKEVALIRRKLVERTELLTEKEVLFESWLN